MDLHDALQTYLEEARELLQSMEEALLLLETDPTDQEAINATFRAAHTIKGSGGLFGLDAIVSFTHTVESVLDQIRNGQVALTGELISLLLHCRDHIGILIQQTAVAGGAVGAEEQTAGAALLTRLQTFLEAPGRTPLPSEMAGARVESAAAHNGEHDYWHISLRFSPDCLKNGLDPLSFLRYLCTVGRIAHLVTLLDALPDAEDMDPQTCYLGCEIDLESEADKATIEAVFEFIREGTLLRILPPHSRIEDYIQLLQDLPEEPARLGELLVETGILTQKELQEALRCQQQARETQGSTKPLGEILVESQIVQQPVVAAALEKQKLVEEKRSQEHQYVKVQADKLDQLINLVGELVIAGASASVQAKRSRDAGFLESASLITRLVEEIRDHALQLRMVEVGEIFNRFPRVVRDVSRELGKDIDLQIRGAETELDKSMVEKLSDPLMHLVRNAMDHGIEASELRRERGKPGKGSVKLSASHESGSIIIDVSDDGGGLDRERIYHKAVQKGLINAGVSLSDAEIYRLVLEPGFSTAEQVSNLSGRGVGMDVVKRNVEALRGQVEIDSQLGLGTRVRLRLPLTLAIIDGFLVKVGIGFYVIPLDIVEECMELSDRDEHQGDYLSLRGEVLPFVKLGGLFRGDGHKTRRQSIVVIKHANRRAGLVVDELLGELQTVIKPLPKVFTRLKGIGGFSIMGSGEVAHVLDVPALMEITTRRENHQLYPHSQAEMHS